MKITKNIIKGFIQLYVAVSMADYVLEFLQKFPTNVWFNRIVCVMVAGLIAWLLTYVLWDDNRGRKGFD